MTSAKARFTRALAVAAVASLPFTVACDDDTFTGAPRVVQLQLETAFSELSEQYLRAVRYDSVQATANDPNGAIVGSRTVPVPPEASTVDFDLEVELTTPVELVTLTIRLYSTDLVALEGSATFTVDAESEVTTAPTITLNPVAPLLEVNPGAVDLIARGVNPPPTDLMIENPGGEMLTWSAAADAPWISLSTQAGSTDPGGASPLSFDIDASNLAEGIHTATLTLDAIGAVGAPASVPVTLTVTLTPDLGVSVISLDYASPEQSSPAPLSFHVHNDGGGTMDWAASNTHTWLSLSVRSGSLDGGDSIAIDATVNSNQLAAGTYTDNIQVTSSTAPNSPVSIPVTLTLSALPRSDLQVTAAGSGSGNVTSSPAGLDCDIATGTTTGTCLASFIEGNTVTLTATGGVGEMLGAWGGACSGSGSCQVTINGPATVSASFVPAPPTVGVSPTSVFATGEEFSGSVVRPITITNVGGGTLFYSAFGQQQWINAVPSSGSLNAGASQQIDVVLPTDTLQGTYSGQLRVANSADTTDWVMVNVTLTVVPCSASCGGGAATDSIGAAQGRQPAATSLRQTPAAARTGRRR